MYRHEFPILFRRAWLAVLAQLLSSCASTAVHGRCWAQSRLPHEKREGHDYITMASTSPHAGRRVLHWRENT